MPRLNSIRDIFVRFLNDHPDDRVLTWMFGMIVAATIAVVGLDYAEMLQDASEGNIALQRTETALPDTVPSSPSMLPSIIPSLRTGGGDRRAPFRKPDGKLAEKMTFELVEDGRLLATGMIFPGTAVTFKAEIEKRGSYVKTIVLNSTGGSVQDALAMGRMIREKKFATAVENGNLCASSCPLVFAGGVERRAGEKAAIGVHQVFSGGPNEPTGAAGMAEAQHISANCQKYLAEMGVDLAVWVHAMETPKEELFLFKPDELLSLKLATQRGTPPKSVAANASSGS